MNLDEVLGAFRRVATLSWGNPSPTAEQLREAERALGARLPPSYTRFMQECHGSTVPFWSVFWVGSDGRKRKQSPEIVSQNRVLRASLEGFPSYLLAFHVDRTGSYSCFDTRGPSVGGEWPIVFWDHEQHPDERAGDMNAPAHAGFTEWLSEQIDNEE